jgi:NAD(P)H dehydrogenase (quinone)
VRTRVAILGGHGKTGRSVAGALEALGVETRALGRAEWPRLAAALEGSDAAYVVAPNLHPDETEYVADALVAVQEAGVPRVAYHSVASPYLPAMPHHVAKAECEDLVRRSGLVWTILQPGAYLQNLDLTRALEVPYSVDRPFGFADLDEVGRVAARVLTEDGHAGATYELATRVATVRQLAEEAGVTATRVENRAEGRLGAMFAYYDRHGLPVGTKTMDMLLERSTR